MKPFMDSDFLLQTDTAKKLYHDYAKQVPVLDYHCHLVPKEIAEDIHFKNMTELWLGADHYKWRVMRSNGVDEYFITGDAPDEEKFHAFAKALPNCIGNPMYHWCHLELQRYFGINETLSEKNWKEIYDKCNEILQKPEMSAKNLIRMSGVTLVCTTDDPIDDLHYHEQIAADSDFDVQVLPAWRPDLAMSPEKEGFVSYIQKLGEVSGVTITDFTTLKEALGKRLDYFSERGCVVSDHGLDYAEFCPLSEEEENALVIEYRATTDKATVVNLTNHGFFNLAGISNPTPTIENNIVTINANFYTPIDEVSIPTGEVAKVEGTPMDFTTPHTVGERINDKFQQLINGAGYDHCYVLNKIETGSLDLAATCFEPNSGRTMEVYTTEAGVQLYTGNWLNGFEGAHGATFPARSAICFEAQCFPDTPNKPHFPSATLLPGDEYQQVTIYKFGVEK